MKSFRQYVKDELDSPDGSVAAEESMNNNHLNLIDSICTHLFQFDQMEDEQAARRCREEVLVGVGSSNHLSVTPDLLSDFNESQQPTLLESNQNHHANSVSSNQEPREDYRMTDSSFDYLNVLSFSDSEDEGIASVIPITKECQSVPLSPPTTFADFEGSCKLTTQKKRVCKISGCGADCHTIRLCRRHSATRLCSVEGCTNGAQRKHLCHRHGGKRLCRTEGCQRKDRGNGHCVTHGGGSRCKVENCTRIVRKKSLCGRHYKKNFEIL